MRWTGWLIVLLGIGILASSIPIEYHTPGWGDKGASVFPALKTLDTPRRIGWQPVF
jgi:hypothetical protein